jgi:CheY-like chemotaxis protein
MLATCAWTFYLCAPARISFPLFTSSILFCAIRVKKAVSADPKFILLDIRLPDMNGVEVAQHILALKPDISIVGWTA